MNPTTTTATTIDKAQIRSLVNTSDANGLVQNRQALLDFYSQQVTNLDSGMSGPSVAETFRLCGQAFALIFDVIGNTGTHGTPVDALGTPASDTAAQRVGR